MKILVTGGNGFIGTHLCTRLRQEHEVFYLSRPHDVKDEPGACGNTFFFKDNNIASLVCYLRDNQVDGIIHLASFYLQKHEDESIPELIQSNVYLGTAILQAATKAGVKWLLNTGTIWQNYNVPDYSDQYCPVNLYAATKQAFIDLAKFYTETSDLRFCTLKLCDTYGPNDTRRKIFALFAQYAASGEVLRMSSGEQKLDVVHVDQVTEAFLKLARKLQNGEELLAEYVVSSGHQYTLRELATRYEQENRVKLNIEWGALPYREREVMVPYIGNPIQ